MRKRGFFCYRRSDTDFAAFFLNSELEAIFGKHFFIDTSDLQLGVDFPLALRNELDASDVLLVVIGPSWLTLDDEWGRRRIDADGDWVRGEIEFALKKSLAIIPILVGGTRMPPPEALPRTISHLSNYQAFSLQDFGWRDQLASLVKALEARGFTAPGSFDLHPRVAPTARVPLPLTEAELKRAIVELPGWEIKQSYNAGGHPKVVTHIERTFTFPSFRKAVDFMAEMATYCDRREVSHHPDWRNVWKTVIVTLSTWDIGSQVAAVDIEMAKKFNDVYAAQSSSKSSKENG